MRKEGIGDSCDDAEPLESKARDQENTAHRPPRRGDCSETQRGGFSSDFHRSLNQLASLDSCARTKSYVPTASDLGEGLIRKMDSTRIPV